MANISKIKFGNTTYDIKDERARTLDATPTEGSANGVTSGGVWTALQNIAAGGGGENDVFGARMKVFDSWNEWQGTKLQESGEYLHLGETMCFKGGTAKGMAPLIPLMLGDVKEIDRIRKCWVIYGGQEEDMAALPIMYVISAFDEGEKRAKAEFLYQKNEWKGVYHPTNGGYVDLSAGDFEAYVDAEGIYIREGKAMILELTIYPEGMLRPTVAITVGVQGYGLWQDE